MLLEVKNIHVKYDGAEALRGVSFEVEEGSIVTLVGANGAGKTTSLRAISGLLPLASGEIWFQGQRIDKRHPEDIVKMGIAHCPEGRGIFPFMTVLENLQMGAYLRKDWDCVEKDLQVIYQSFPVLKKKAKQKAGSLSGGEQQMLATARALMAKPRLMLLDEPSMGLSPILVQQIGRIISDIRKAKISVLLVEQNALLALRLADYAYVIEAGQIPLHGKGHELLDNQDVKKAYLG
jgi:branched-chain amino acid transport system ATP-binding protein